jgi:hypothetical protein
MSKNCNPASIPKSLWYSTDEKATEGAYRSFWAIRPFFLALPDVEKTLLHNLLQKNAEIARDNFHAKILLARHKYGQQLTDDNLLAISISLLEAYRHRRESEAVFLVLCRDVEQCPPKQLCGAKPC